MDTKKIEQEAKKLSKTIINFISSRTENPKVEYLYFVSAAIEVYKHFGWDDEDNPVNRLIEENERKETEKILEQRFNDFKKMLKIIRDDGLEV